MTRLKGREGDMAIGGTNAVAEIRDWKLNITSGDIDGNVMQSGEWDISEGGRKAWTAEVNCFYDPSDATGQMAFVEGADVVCNFYAEGNTTGNEDRSGTARVTEIEISGSGEGDSFFEFSAKLRGVGALTLGSVT